MIKKRQFFIIMAIAVIGLFSYGCSCCGGTAGQDYNMPNVPSIAPPTLPPSTPPPPPRYPPEISPAIPDQNYIEDSGNHTISLVSHGTDREDGVLAWSVTNVDTNLYTISILPDKIAFLTLKPDAFGTGRPVFVLTDSDGMSARQAITITIANVNDAPVITSEPITEVRANQTYQYQIEVREVDGDAVIAELTTQPAGMTINNVTGLIRWVPSINQIGNHTVRLRVRDPSNEQDVQNFQIMVKPRATTADERVWIDICLPIQDLALKDQCYTNLAVVNNNGTYCEKASAARRQQCGQALIDHNSALCDAISSIVYRNYCYRELAVQQNNAAYCEPITDDVIKQGCLDLAGV